MRKDGTVPMKREYDLSKMQGERGKYHEAFRSGHTVKIRNKKGEVAVQYFKPEVGAVVLEPDVLKYFPDAESVNATLRSIIHLIPSGPRAQIRRKPALRNV
jgi:hypothetical protein